MIVFVVITAKLVKFIVNVFKCQLRRLVDVETATEMTVSRV